MKKKLKILFVTAIVLEVVKVYLCSCLSTSGMELAEVQKEIERLEIENREIEGEIAKNSSIKQIYQKALFLGFKQNYGQDYFFEEYSFGSSIAHNQ